MIRPQATSPRDNDFCGVIISEAYGSLAFFQFNIRKIAIILPHAPRELFVL